MRQVFAPPVSANNLQTCFPMHSPAHISVFVYYYMNVSSMLVSGQLQKTTGPRKVTLSDTGQGQESLYWPGVESISQKNQVG